jgi:hypothetical protein
MSQSDYIKFKKITEMNSQTEFSPVLTPVITRSIKKFYVGNVKDTTVYFNKLVKSDKQVVFDMEVSNGVAAISDVREDQRAGLSRSDEGRITRRGR